MADLQETIDLRRRARRRLIGAIALVLALVIVPPWIMDLEPKPAATKLTVEIPPQDGGRIKPPVKPVVPEAAPKAPDPVKPPVPGKAQDAAKPQEPAKPAASKPPAPASAPSAPAPSASSSLDARTVAALGAPKTEGGAEPPRAADDRSAGTSGTPPAKKPAEAPAAPAPAAEAFVVPLGSYASADNVRQLQARLAQEGIQSYTEPIKTAAGERTRVRAGPYASREAAEKARERVKGMGIDAGNVIARQ